MRWRRRLQKGLYEDPHLETVPFWPLTDGEIHYLYWFMQGGIMNVDTRWALRRAWGFCARHAWAALAVEMAFRSDYLLGPAILWVDLLERCLIAWRLRPTGSCTICNMGIYWATKGAAKTEVLEQGRQPSYCGGGWGRPPTITVGPADNPTASLRSRIISLIGMSGNSIRAGLSLRHCKKSICSLCFTLA